MNLFPDKIKNLMIPCEFDLEEFLLSNNRNTSSNALMKRTINNSNNNNNFSSNQSDENVSGSTTHEIKNIYLASPKDFNDKTSIK